MTFQPFAPAPSEPLSQQVARQLRDLIFKEQRFAPGDRLPNERSLAHELGVSRTSLREAIKILTANGILVIRRGVGTFVSETPGQQTDPFGFSLVEDKKKFLRDWYQVRLTLEPEVVELVAQNAKDEELQALADLVERQYEAYNSVPDQDEINEPRIFMELDRDFHAALAAASHSYVIERVLPALLDWVFFELVIDEYKRMPEHLRKNAQENHRAIVTFLKRRDDKGASLAMRYHMLAAMEDLEK